MRVPVMVFQVLCPCGAIAEYSQCQGSSSDFETYLGRSTHTIYRLDLDLVHYLKRDKAELLRSAGEAEGGAHART